MADALWLNVLLYLPVAGCALLLALPSARGDAIRTLTLVVTLAQFVIAVFLYIGFDATVSGPQFVTHVPWIPAWGVYYEIGLDGYNVLLVLLTAFLGPLVVAGAFSAIRKDVKFFYITVLMVQFAMLGAFLAQDLFLFYLFWEAMMIPMFLII
ncbi:MAG: Fe-S-binding domain-containing protein, partial [Betaproteobacteria bacterium]